MSEKYYFKKSIVSNPIRLKSGKLVEWALVARNEGVLETSNEEAVLALSNLALGHKLGVTLLTQAEYEDLKKNGALRLAARSPLISFPVPTHQPPSPPPLKLPAAAAPEAQRAEASAGKKEARREKPATGRGVLPE